MYVVKLRNGEIDHVKLHHYPDGQYNVQLDMAYFHNPKEEVNILCNIVQFNDWEKLLALVGALKQADFLINEIRFLYIMGCRSDRAFERGMPNYVRDVMKPITDYLYESCESMKFLVPHGRADKYFPSHYGSANWTTPIRVRESCIIAADESAQMLAENCGTDYRKVPYFMKKREGDEIIVTLSDKFHEEINQSDQPICIVDDLCDGGKTFEVIGEYLAHHFSGRKFYLFVMHGLFTKGLDVLLTHYDTIWTTNSYPQNDGVDEIKLSQFNIIDVWGNQYDR